MNQTQTSPSLAPAPPPSVRLPLLLLLLPLGLSVALNGYLLLADGTSAALPAETTSPVPTAGEQAVRAELTRTRQLLDACRGTAGGAPSHSTTSRPK